ncbi:MAG: UpxY family transcription antiterminator [Acidobacteriaceae bacterium]|nr:UpxY family transcription antiterminator [Acidobacteriaceae bacterium]
MRETILGPTQRELCLEAPGFGDFLSAQDTRCWFAVTVKPQHEVVAQQALSAKGLDAFAPAYWTARRWSDRVKRLQQRLFPGYVFCRFDAGDRAAVLRTHGIRSIVSFGNELAPIPDSEIVAIQEMLASEYPVEPCHYVRVGQRVRITEGPLAGIEGILVHHRKATRVVVGIELLQRSVAVEVNPESLLPLS